MAEVKFAAIQIAPAAQGDAPYFVWGVPADGSPVLVKDMIAASSAERAGMYAGQLAAESGAPIVDGTGGQVTTGGAA